jgi:hypothetical protein
MFKMLHTQDGSIKIQILDRRWPIGSSLCQWMWLPTDVGTMAAATPVYRTADVAAAGWDLQSTMSLPSKPEVIQWM